MICMIDQPGIDSQERSFSVTFPQNAFFITMHIRVGHLALLT